MKCHRSATSCRLHHMQRLWIAPLRQQRSFARLGFLQMRMLDVAIAANVLRNAGDLRSQADVIGIQPFQQHVHGCKVIGNQLALARRSAL